MITAPPYLYLVCRFKCLWIAILSLGFVLSSAQVLRAEPQAPQQGLEAFLTTIRAMQFPVQDPSRHEQLVRQANAFLDLEAMAKAALGARWQEATSEKQIIFMDLLWKLIAQVAYPRSREFLGDFQIRYPEVRRDSNGFEVHSVVKHEEEALDAKVVYHVYQGDGQWKIDDVVLDGVSLIEDMSYQFDKIIQGSGFSGLLERMKERLDQAVRENESKAT